MARKALVMTEKKIEQFINQGRGQGEGSKYQPWIQIGDFSSKGRGQRIPDHRTGRIHHLFSDLEAEYYHILAWADSVIDIREQFPLLPRCETEVIADHLGFSHPRSPGSAINNVMTTDFLVTISDGQSTRYEARYVKYSNELSDHRTCEKLAIEAQYWEAHKVPFKIVTEKSFNRIKAKNIERILAYYPNSYQNGINEYSSRNLTELILEAITLPNNRFLPLKDCTANIDCRFGFDAGTSLGIFFHLAAHKIIPLHMEKKIIGTLPIDELINWPQLTISIDEKEGLQHDNYA